MALLLNINIQIEDILIARPYCALLFLAGKENIFLHKKGFIYKVYLAVSMTGNKHMMKNGAPPDKIGVLHRLLSIELHGFTNRIDF